MLKANFKSSKKNCYLIVFMLFKKIFSHMKTGVMRGIRLTTEKQMMLTTSQKCGANIDLSNYYKFVKTKIYIYVTRTENSSHFTIQCNEI